MASLSIKPVTKPAKGHNRYCGPSAISIITGLDTAQAAALLRQVGGRPSIKGTPISEMLGAFRQLSYDATPVTGALAPRDRPTLAAWLRDTTKTRGSDLYLIIAGNHYQVVQGRRFCCGQTGEIISIADKRAGRRRRVTGIWRVTAKFEAPLMKKEAARVAAALAPKPASPAQKVEASPRQKANRLADKHGIEIERLQGGGLNVWGPSFRDDASEEECDPFCGDHYACDWDEALQRVEAYVALKAAKPHWFY